MLQRLRLATGLVLFTYVTSHLLNHSLGLISIQAAEAGRVWFTAVWRHPLGTSLLYGSLLLHIALALVAIYRRRHFRVPRWEILRLALGLAIPWFLHQHAFATRAIHEVSGIDDSYTRQVVFFWVLQPVRGIQQIVLLAIAWAHGCLGLYFWLRVKPWRPVTLRVLRILALLIPVLAIGGFVDMGQEVSQLASDSVWWSVLSPLRLRKKARLSLSGEIW
jgi:adenylate cyclase